MERVDGALTCRGEAAAIASTGRHGNCGGKAAFPNPGAELRAFPLAAHPPPLVTSHSPDLQLSC
jgi:hypothetical protein